MDRICFIGGGSVVKEPGVKVIRHSGEGLWSVPFNFGLRIGYYGILSYYPYSRMLDAEHVRSRAEAKRRLKRRDYP